MKNTKKTIYLVMLIPALFFLNSGVSQIPIIEWQNTIGGSGSDYLFATLQTEDGGFILSGHSYSGISGDKTEANFGLSGTNDYWIVKTNWELLNGKTLLVEQILIICTVLKQLLMVDIF